MKAPRKTEPTADDRIAILEKRVEVLMHHLHQVRGGHDDDPIKAAWDSCADKADE